MLKNRIRKNIRALKSYLNNNDIQAYRIYDHDIPEYPFFIEQFCNKAVVWERTKPELDAPVEVLRQKNEISDLLKELGIDEIFFKHRFPQGTESRYSKQSESHTIDVRENGLVFEIELCRYIDCGLFLDHRPLRSWLLKTPACNALNLFCYTGSLSVALAKNGSKTTNVDLSKTYLSWAQRNFNKNNINPNQHDFVNLPTLDYLKSCRDKFDIIILDPPTFSASKKTDSSFEIQRDHADLIHRCLQLLNPDGEIYFSTNKKKFKLSLTDGLSVTDLSPQSIPPDFHRKNVHRLWKIRN